MKRIVMMMVAGLAMLPGGGHAQESIEFDGRTWLTTAQDAKVEQFMGREALLLRNGGVFLPDVQFQDGIVEYDVAVTGHRSFVGTAFRVRQEPRVEYEHFYIRPHQTGRFDAQQYTPEINGMAAWQLYGEFNQPVDVPAGEWIHVKLVIEGARLEAYVGDVDEPTLVVETLRLDAGPGLIGLTSNFPQAGALDLYPTAYSNVRILVNESPTVVEDTGPPETALGTISRWALSESVAGPAGEPSEIVAENVGDLSWDVVSTDALGRINIAEHRAFVPGVPGAHVFARVNIHSDHAQTRALNFGFSDKGAVFLNGDLLFTGDNTYRSRSLRYLGAMTVDNDALYLKLNEGDNELVFVVSEAFGGWGLVARLDEMDGITLTAEAPSRD
jgi:hypothetical protein